MLFVQVVNQPFFFGSQQLKRGQWSVIAPIERLAPIVIRITVRQSISAHVQREN
jgi:hypothetical protein